MSLLNPSLLLRVKKSPARGKTMIKWSFPDLFLNFSLTVNRIQIFEWSFEQLIFMTIRLSTTKPGLPFLSVIMAYLIFIVYIMLYLTHGFSINYFLLTVKSVCK